MSSVQLTRRSLAWPTVSAVWYQPLWHPGSERPVYPALPAQRSCLLATHNILVQKTTAIDASGTEFILQQWSRPGGTLGAAEQYVHYLMNIKGPQVDELRDSGRTMKWNSIAQGHRCGHDLDSSSAPFQRDFPEIWHDTPGQYIECTCKLKTSINIMTNNIMIFNQLLIMQHSMSTCCDQARTSLRTAYQL